MNNQDNSHAQCEAPPSSWLDPALYIIAGIGLFFLAAYSARLVSSLIGEWTVLQSSASWLLNAICLGGIVYMLGVRRGRISWLRIGLIPVRWRWRWLIAAVVITVISVTLRIPIVNWIRARIFWDPFGMGAEGVSRTTFIVGTDHSFSWVNLALVLFSMGVLIPFSEELYFRGLLHSSFQSRVGLGLRILLSSLLFGLWHLPAISSAVSSFLLGLVLAIAYELSRSIWLPIVLHVTHNILLVALVYLAVAVAGT
jgi:membrane protease YdiL (CAAX protease family)